MRTLLASLFTGAAAAESKALALEGGGWRAQACDAGFVSGLLAFLGKQKGTAPTLSGTGLLEDFDHFSSNSGSTWFFSSLAYSQGYHDLVESMAASPSTAAAQYKEKFTTPYLNATNVDPYKFDGLNDLARYLEAKVFGKGDEETIYLFQYFLATDTTWNEFTDVLLRSTAQIGANTKMGSDVMPFAKDKVWMASNSVLLPTGKEKARLYQRGLGGLVRASYQAKSTAALPLVLPAKFSIQMGAGADSAAPHEFLASTALSADVELDFTSMIVPLFDTPHAESGLVDLRDFSAGAMTDGAGLLPVNRVASTSSAAGGIAPVLGLLANAGLSIFDADLTPWASNAAKGETFYVANNLVNGLREEWGITKSSMQGLASAQVHGLIDGGYTDGTGLAHAVGAGADEVLVLLNSNATNDPFYVELLFKDGPDPVSPGASRDIFPVFASPPAQQVVTGFQGFHKLSLPSNTYIKEIAVGTVKATTADNKYFGINGGRNITINIINFCSSLGIGGGVDFDKYDNLIQEIIVAFNDDQNTDFMSATLLPMVVGSSAIPTSVIV